MAGVVSTLCRPCAFVVPTNRGVANTRRIADAPSEGHSRLSRPRARRESSNGGLFTRLPTGEASVDQTRCATKKSFCVKGISRISTCYSPGCEHFLWITRRRGRRAVPGTCHMRMGRSRDAAMAQELRATFFLHPIKGLRQLCASCPPACKQILWITNFPEAPHYASFSSTGHNFRARPLFPFESVTCHAFPQVINRLVNKMCG